MELDSVILNSYDCNKIWLIIIPVSINVKMVCFIEINISVNHFASLPGMDIIIL